MVQAPRICKRFDEDVRSSLRGENVWAQLVADGRATVVGGLAGDYLAALFSSFDRNLTPHEVVQALTRTPVSRWCRRPTRSAG